MKTTEDIKTARTEVRIEAVLARRWSPYSFADRDVSSEDLCAILEAARWAPSSYNEQPWCYLLARRSDALSFEKMLSCLVEANQVWAKYAPVLLIGLATLKFARSSEPNRAAIHDLGLATANLTVEATARGLSVHQMIGIVPARVHELYRVPEHVEPFTALAVGYCGDGGRLPQALRERDRAPRTRRRVGEFVFEDSWGNPAQLKTGGRILM